MDANHHELPTTSYAILGMLALRPWTAYELTKQIRRSLDYCWPKAESVLYDEPKRLVTLGLASGAEEPVGHRTRVRYAITGSGRRALRTWLASPTREPRLEIEPMLRLLFADHGGKDDVLRAVRDLGQWADVRHATGREQIRGYLDDGGPFPERLHITTLFAVLYAELLEVIGDWARFADAEISRWPRTDGLGLTTRSRRILEDVLAHDEARSTGERYGH